MYGALPPVGFTVAVPVLPPLHKTAVEDEVSVAATFTVTVTVAVPVQPLAFVPVTVYVVVTVGVAVTDAPVEELNVAAGVQT